MEPLQYLLSPKTLNKEDKAYSAVNELKSILEKDCSNIALTGGFGSGKSSILKTLEEETSEKKYLKVSLATLDEENNISISLIQQLIYKSNTNKLHQSRIKRILHLSDEEEQYMIYKTIFFIISLFILFEPNWLRVETFYQLSEKYINIWIIYIINLLLLVYVLYILYFIIRRVFRIFNNSKIQKLIFKESGIEFTESTSIFNKHLDEIIYFFQVNSFDVVIFEDLDRVKASKEIFLKLREINLLINDSEFQLKRVGKLKFIYATKDDIFDEDERIKYFDYIVTIVPVISKINASDKLVDFLGESKINLDLRYCSELGFYINDMREMKNIVNEFIQYNNQIRIDLQIHKLFAIILYKNKFPNDFNKLQNRSGFLFNILSKKHQFVQIVIEESEKKKLKLEDAIFSLKEQIFSVRRKYIENIKSKNNLTGFVVSNNYVNLEQFIQNDTYFDSLTKNKVLNYYIENPNTLGRNEFEYKIKFEEIEKGTSPNETYNNKIQYYKKRINDIENEITILKKEIISTGKNSFSKIIKLCDSESALEIIRAEYDSIYSNEEKIKIETSMKNVCVFALILIKNGYIDDDYSKYISNFYNGYLSDADNEFYLKNMAGISCGYDFNLNNTEEIANKVPHEYFSNDSILNYQLLDYLLKNSQDFESEISQIINIVVEKQNLDFVIGYYEKGKFIKKFFNLLFSQWEYFLDFINEDQNEQVTNTCLVIFLNFGRKACNMQSFNSPILSNSYQFIIDNFFKLNIDSVKDIIIKLDVKFNNIVSVQNEELKTFYDFVIEHKRYEITYDNLKIIIGKDFDNHSYTSILNSKNISIQEYIDENIETAMINFPDTSIKESEDVIKKLLSFDEINFKIRSEYFLKQEIKLLSLFELKDEFLITAFDYDKITPSWENVFTYYRFLNNTISDNLLNFISRNNVELVKNELPKSDDNIEHEFFISIFGNDLLDVEVYNKLLDVFKFICTKVDLSKLGKERIKILINKKKLEYNQYYVDFLIENHSSKVFSNYLIKNFDKFLSDKNVNFTLSNEDGDYILDSELTLNQKKQFLDSTYNKVEDNDDYTIKYSNKICFYYSLINLDNSTNLNLIMSALDFSTSWIDKIRLINKVNKYYGYDKQRVNSLMISLGDEYIKLTLSRKRPKFEFNNENKELIDFLQSKDHISKNKLEDKYILVSMGEV